MSEVFNEFLTFLLKWPKTIKAIFFNLEIISRWDSRLNICFYKKFVSLPKKWVRVDSQVSGRRLVIACLCIQCTQHLFIGWWMKNDMQQVYRALSQPMMSTHICNSDGFIPLKQSIFSSSASSNLQISFDLFDNHVLPTLKTWSLN